MDTSLPEGFHPDADGSFRGIPAWAMQRGNAVAASLIQKRQWDVPCIADEIFEAYKRGLEEKQRIVYHIKCGDDTWTPTAEELSSVVKCFCEASSVDDGMRAVVATNCMTTVYVQRLTVTQDTQFVAHSHEDDVGDMPI